MSFDPLLALGAAGGVSPLVRDLGLCLVAAGILSALFVRLKIPAIAALLGAGVVLGPAGLEAIGDRASVDTIANLGLTLLLFVIGLEVNLGSLLSSGRTLIVTGLVQVPLTLAIGTGLFLAIGASGWSLFGNTYADLYFGVACTFSSTLLVVKYLHERRALDSVAGRLCIGLLIFQDVWAIIFLALQPSFADPSVMPILKTFGGTALLGLAAALVARFVLVHAFHVVARSPELVVTLALAWCFGVGLAGTQISVSMEMGALIAGATIATSPFAYEVVARVIYLRDFFVTLFFVGLGMSIPVPDGPDVLVIAAIIAVVAIALRYVIFLPLLYATGLDRRNAVAVSTKLAQVSEFCLVILYLAAKLGQVDGMHVSAVIFAFVLTALATPFLFGMSDRLYLSLRGLLDKLGIRSRGVKPEAESENPPRLVLLGFHRVASALLAEIERTEPELVPETMVIDINSGLHEQLRQRGVQVVYGDMSSTEVLRHAGIDKAKVIVSTVPDTLLRGTSNAQIVRQLRQLAPDAVIIACADRASDVKLVRDAGADHAFRPPAEVAIGLVPAVIAGLEGTMPGFVESYTEQHGARADHPEVLD
ncbi:MAG: cation:proton antiporter [Deltaproteobacteria bacterium]|nr:cation:proton antiporter [Kofleriaceae bacterium]